MSNTGAAYHLGYPEDPAMDAAVAEFRSQVKEISKADRNSLGQLRYDWRAVEAIVRAYRIAREDGQIEAAIQRHRETRARIHGGPGSYSCFGDFAT